jgi:hypothetical protein
MVKDVGTLAVWLTMPRDDFQKGVREAQRDIGKLSSVIGGFAIAGAASITAFATKSVAAFMENETAVGALEAALSAAGDNVEKFSSRYQKFSEDMMAKTIFDHDKVLEIMAYGKQMGIAADQLEDAAKAAVGLSAKYNIDLSTAMGLIAKANLGATERLKRYGIVLDENMTKEEKFAALLKIGGESFGLAEAKTQTLSGAISQLKNNFAEIEEETGKMIVEGLNLKGVFQALSGAALDVSKYIGGLDDATKNAIARTGLLAVGVVSLASAWKVLTYTGMLQGVAGLGKYIILIATHTAAQKSATVAIIEQINAQLALNAAQASAAKINAMSFTSQLKDLPALTFAGASAMNAFGSAVAVVGVAWASWEIGKKISELTGLDNLLTDFYAKYLFGAEEIQRKSDELNKKIEAAWGTRDNRKFSNGGLSAIVADDLTQEAKNNAFRFQRDLKDMQSDNAAKNLEGLEKINALKEKQNRLDEITRNLDPKKREENIKEKLKIGFEIEDVYKTMAKDAIAAQESLDNTISDIKLKNATTLEEKLEILAKKRIDAELAAVYGKDEAEKKKAEERALIIADQMDNLRKQDAEKSKEKYVAPRLAGAIEQGTVEAYRAELAGKNSDLEYTKKTADNTDRTAKGIQQLVTAFKPFGSLGVA